MCCLECSWVGCTIYKHHDTCPKSKSQVQVLQQMLEDVIATGIHIGYSNMSFCRFCSARGHWTDNGPVIPQHTEDCITVRYAKYMEEWQ